MSSSEAYLDSLLAALSGEQNKDEVMEPEVMSEAEVQQEMPEVAMEEPTEEIPIIPVSDEPNKALGPDEIAALFAQANMDIETGDSIEAEAEMPGVEEAESEEVAEPEIMMQEAEPEVAMEEPAEEMPEVAMEEPTEEIPIIPVSDDPNKALGADEIAALFAQANMDIETGDSIEAEAEMPETEEQTAEPEIVMEEMAESEEEVEETEETEEQEVVMEEPEEMPVLPVSDDPNKALGAEEIAALFAQANMDIETGDSLEEMADEVSDGEEMEVSESELNDAVSLGAVSLDDLLEGLSGEDEEEHESEVQAWEQEEVEIDLDNPEDLKFLLGIGERPERVKKAVDSEASTEQTAEELLASMGEENPDLNEINELLGKVDNNELVNDGIEESVLVGFEDADYDEEQDPWLDELLGGSEGKASKGKTKKEKKKKKFPFFSKKKKEDEASTEISSEDLTEVEKSIPTEISEQDTEEINDILQVFSEDNSEIPFDLFGDEEDGAADMDLMSLVEADTAKDTKKKNFFSKMMDVLTEEIPEEEEVVKVKKEKKGKKGKKKPVTDADDNEGILEELDAEEAAGKKKEKKPKKIKLKKEKPAPVPDPFADKKKLPVKMIVRIFALCLSVMALILLVTYFIPKVWSLADARNAFYKRDYETAYHELSGRELSESDQRLYEKSKMILQLDHKMNAYENYKVLNMPVEALDSLLSGYMLWQQLAEKIAEYDAVAEMEEIKNRIVNVLSSEYQISEQEAAEINSLSNYDYTLRLEEITGSLSRQNSAFQMIDGATEEDENGQAVVETSEEATTQEMEQPKEPTEDVLSEEAVQ